MASYPGGNPKNQALLKYAKCNRCGSADVAWVKSSKGKWYLVQGGNFPGKGMEKDAQGNLQGIFSKVAFHKCAIAEQPTPPGGP
jgi:hypothetical protein